MFSKLLLAGLLGAALTAPNKPANDDKYLVPHDRKLSKSHLFREYKKMTPEAAASCDPDYGWINGPDDSNKCYMILRYTAAIKKPAFLTNLFIGTQRSPTVA